MNSAPPTDATATGLKEAIAHAAELLLTLSRVTPRRTINPNVPLGRDILETAERLAALLPSGSVTIEEDRRRLSMASDQLTAALNLRGSGVPAGRWGWAMDHGVWLLKLAERAITAPSVSVGGEREALALRAIKAVTATAKDGPAGLARIMTITSASGVKAPYHELLTDPDVALIVERPRTEWAHLFKPGVDGCVLPPETWRCTRTRGHSGPCATVSALAAPETPPTEGEG